MSDQNDQFKITVEERNLLDFFRDTLKWGRATVVVKRGQPVFVKMAYKDVKLDVKLD
ncbi:MAG: hypothetical protein WC260_03850 [Candidatus Pacearchaeota archaeon]